MRWCFVAALGALAAPAAAKEIAVYRCESPAGVPVYSDQPCGAGTVLRLDREGTRPPVAAEGIAAEAPAEAPPGTCPARTAADLPAAVSDAFASGDANRLASLYHWTGLTDADARRMFGRFDALLAEPLRNVGVGSAIHSAGERGFDAALEAPDALPAGELWLELGPAQVPRQVRFRIVHHAGCAWLSSG